MRNEKSLNIRQISLFKSFSIVSSELLVFPACFQAQAQKTKTVHPEKMSCISGDGTFKPKLSKQKISYILGNGSL